MDKTFEQGKDEVARLCDYFRVNRNEFRARNEAQVRQQLIDPLFEALGWDVGNSEQVAPQYAEVVTEQSQDDEGPRKAPDYTFRVGTLPRFYVEAKRCSIDISSDPAPAFQLRRYGWNTRLMLSLLTNFEELGVYDCTVRPRQNDKASRSRISLFRFPEYADRWRELWDVFSREAVWSGAFDQYAASKRKRGTSEVDEEFLKEIEGWRETLARNIALRNKGIAHDDLNAAVQLTIDRVVFLRMAEDQGLEPYQQLLNLCDHPEIFSRFVRKLCQRADEKYNAGLFHFEKEAGVSEAPDRITPKLTVDDKVFQPILQSLYFEHGSPYDFRLMPVEILGTIYERFLGKVIRLTVGHQAKVEEKPEVRKAGGVYYTPAYIAQYIVAQTVGVKVAGRSPAQLSGGKGKPPVRVLDMACGSGSFLLAAYQCLLQHCLEWYVKNRPERCPAAVCKNGRTSEWRLTIAEKKRILTTHIFGVDIDRQAVEVTKLSLLLKVLEGENEQTVARQLQLFHDRALPNLAENIKCGNSLIGPDYFSGKLIPDADEMKRVNAFDWQQGFPDAMKEGGFDCVVGNPPWLMAGYYVADEIDYMRQKFRTAKGKFDLYYLFIENGLSLANDSGRFGLIVPNKFFHTKAATRLREFLREKACLQTLVDFGDSQVFSGATNYSCIIFLGHDPVKCVRHVRAKAGLSIVAETTVPSSSLNDDAWHFETEDKRALFKKMEKIGKPLQTLVARFGTGVQSGADRVLTIERQQAKQRRLEKDVLRPILRGRDVRRYAVANSPRLLIFPYTVVRGDFVLLPERELQGRRNVYKILSDNRKTLTSRVWFGKGGQELSGQWYGMMYLDACQSFSSPHLLTPSLSNRSNFTFGKGDLFATGTAGVTSIIPRKDIQEDILYLLGLLNSRLLSFYAIGHSPVFSGAYYKFSAPYLKQLPIRRIDFFHAADKDSHERIVKLAEAMLALHKQLRAAKSEAHRTTIQRQIDATDAEIDRLVYDLYGLTAKEIAIVERCTAQA
ncbi:MAG: N-6 DNA methylase [Thermoguttaceae bacterium]|jgi:hypothetical protein